MNVNSEEYISLLKISGLTKAMIRVYYDTLTGERYGGLRTMLGQIDKEIKHHEALHGLGVERAGASKELGV